MDLADYLISEQQLRIDPLNRATYADLVEERISKLMMDRGLDEGTAAERRGGGSSPGARRRDRPPRGAGAGHVARAGGRPGGRDCDVDR